MPKPELYMIYTGDRKEIPDTIKKWKLSLEEIAEYVPSISMEELKRLESEVMQLA